MRSDFKQATRELDTLAADIEGNIERIFALTQRLTMAMIHIKQLYYQSGWRDVDDMAQDVAEIVLRRLPGFNPDRASLSDYILMSIKAGLVTSLKTAHRRKHLIADMAERGDAPANDSGEETFWNYLGRLGACYHGDLCDEISEFQTLFDVMTEASSDMERRVIELRFVHGFSLKEVSKIMKINYKSGDNAVSRFLQRASARRNEWAHHPRLSPELSAELTACIDARTKRKAGYNIERAVVNWPPDDVLREMRLIESAGRIAQLLGTNKYNVLRYCGEHGIPGVGTGERHRNRMTFDEFRNRFQEWDATERQEVSAV